MPRWSSKENLCLKSVKLRLQVEIASSPQFSEVVGDRKIVRFLRGHNYDVEKVCGLMANFLKWRINNGINEIRTAIVEGGCDHPLKFPKGDIILRHIPQLVVLPEAQDNFGSPICVEQYNFVPSEVFKHISIEDYVLFVKYSLEYRSLVLEQLSEQREREFLKSLSEAERLRLDEDMDSKPYGVLVNICVIRDLNGVGFTHLSQQGQDIIKTIVSLASDNYPELMRKCFMINTPFVFNAVWFVIKGLLAARTIAKVSVRGSGYMEELLQEIAFDKLPTMVGGGYAGYVEYTPFPWDVEYLVPASGSNQHSRMKELTPSVGSESSHDGSQPSAIYEVESSTVDSSSVDGWKPLLSHPVDASSPPPTFNGRDSVVDASERSSAAPSQPDNEQTEIADDEVDIISLRTAGY